MSSQYKRKIKIVSISKEFYKLFPPENEIMQKLGWNTSERPCLVLVKLRYKKMKYTFAIPFRSNIGKAPRESYFPLPNRNKTKPNRKHGLHYTKMFPINKKYFIKYEMGGDLQEELVLAYIEKNIKTIINEAQHYLDEYGKGHFQKYHVDIDEVIKMLLKKLRNKISNKEY